MDLRDLAAAQSAPLENTSAIPVSEVPEWLQAQHTAISGQPASYDEHGDGSSKLWLAYLSQANNYDKEMSNSWKGDMEGILVFTGLLSAIQGPKYRASARGSISGVGNVSGYP
ncbi:hypothetical protein OF83DRAFT_1127280, partial [Amylostereum chailletii]